MLLLLLGLRVAFKIPVQDRHIQCLWLCQSVSQEGILSGFIVIAAQSCSVCFGEVHTATTAAKLALDASHFPLMAYSSYPQTISLVNVKHIVCFNTMLRGERRSHTLCLGHVALVSVF